MVAVTIYCFTVTLKNVEIIQHPEDGVLGEFKAEDHGSSTSD